MNEGCEDDETFLLLVHKHIFSCYRHPFYGRCIRIDAARKNMLDCHRTGDLADGDAYKCLPVT